jgi:serine protease AprX
MAGLPAAGEGRSAGDMSREQVDWFLQKRRPKQRAELVAAVGGDVVGKLHPWVVGQILDEREEAKFAFWTGGPAPTEVPKHEVMINLASGLVTAAVPGGPAARRPVSKVDRGTAVDQRQAAADFALESLRADLERRGIDIEQEFWLTHSVLATLTTPEVLAIAARADVSTISSDKPQPVLALNVSRPHIRADQMPPGISGAGVSVAIVDTGVDASHPDLAGVVGAQQDMTGTAVTRDDVGHGTHCAGIVASQNATFRGIAPGARLIDIRIMSGTGNARPSWATAGLAAAVTSGADVASNSWGYTHRNGAWVDANGTCVVCTAADQAAAMGVVVVVAAGNEGDDICGSYDTIIRCPGIARNVITVGATDDADALATFSSTGQTPDGRLKPEIAAPGVGIASLMATTATLPGSTFVQPGIISADGTSMAAPHIAGVCALILNKNGGLTPAQVKQLVITSRVSIPSLPLVWFGRIDALTAVNATPAPP